MFGREPVVIGEIVKTLLVLATLLGLPVDEEIQLAISGLVVTLITWFVQRKNVTPV